MDTVRCKEWRIFPVTLRMEDEAGYLVFTALHVTIYVLLLWGLYADDGVNRALIACLDVFLVVHMFLHLLLRNIPGNQFRSAFSWVLILGAPTCSVPCPRTGRRYSRTRRSRRWLRKDLDHQSNDRLFIRASPARFFFAVSIVSASYQEEHPCALVCRSPSSGAVSYPDPRDGSSALNKPPLSIVACNYGARPSRL